MNGEPGSSSGRPGPPAEGRIPGRSIASGAPRRGGLPEVFVADEQEDIPVDTDRWLRLATAVLVAEGVDADVEMSLLFVDEASIAALNERFMGKASPTDVLSFPIDEDVVVSGRSPDNGGTGPVDDDEVDEDDVPLILGDVVVCPVVAARNAPEHVGSHHDGSLEDELALLVVHGILHLLGLDHEDEAEAEAMEARERELLQQFHRVPNGDGHGGDDRGDDEGAFGAEISGGDASPAGEYDELAELDELAAHDEAVLEELAALDERDAGPGRAEGTRE